ncbi:MAG: nucleotidyltransferase domain-containing protein [Chloroflexi bacterium]|nr:nucleotidyltransferase domain-containing protein [Chloroflexota bacterium]
MITLSANNNLSNILFGKSRQAILSLLYSHVDEAFYLRQIVRTTGIGLGPAQRELKQLLDAGIIIRNVEGKQVYYRANKKSPIFNELRNIVMKTFGAADVIRQSLETVADKVRVAFIFGSVARSTDGRASDIDLIIIGKVTFGDAVSSLSQAEEILEREINPVVYSVAEFKKRVAEKHFFITDVLEGDKIFIIGDEDELGRLAKQRLADKT